MRLLKRLVVLAGLLALGYAGLWIYQGPFFALSQIGKGLELKDPGLVERYADLEKIVVSSATVLAEIGKEEVGVGGGDVGSALLGALVGVVAGQVGAAVAPEAALEMRKAILAGTMQRGVGPFEVHSGLKAFGDFEIFPQHATVTLRGTCKSYDAKLKVVLERRDAGMPFGLVDKHLLVGIDKDSAKELARACTAK
jgi:hypothetical protein